MLARITTAVSVLLISCSPSGTSVTAEKDIYPVTSALVADTITYEEYAAEILAVQNVEIRARVEGFLEKIHTDEGRMVKKDQLLFTINRNTYRENLAKAEALYHNALAEHEAAELQLGSIRELNNNNVVSKMELDLARNKVKAAKAKVDEALAEKTRAGYELSYTEIRSPFDGVLNRIPFKEGSLLTEGALLTTISSIDQVFAYFDVSERDYLTYASEQSAGRIPEKRLNLVLANGEVFPFEGMIETTEGEIDPRTGSIAFRARFPNPNHVIKHGSSGKVRLRNTLRQAMLIPQKATFEIQDKLYVYVVGKDNKVSPRNITVSKRLQHLYAVSRGLSENEIFVYEGIQDLRENDVISTRHIPMREILRQLSTIKGAN